MVVEEDDGFLVKVNMPIDESIPAYDPADMGGWVRDLS